MSNKVRRQRIPKAHQRAPRSRRRAMIVVTLLVVLSAAGIIGAQWIGTAATPTHLASAPVPQDTPLESQEFKLRKEYIYAGGRLLATEEPTPTTKATPDATPTPTSASGSASLQSLSLNGTDAYAQVGDTNNSLDLANNPLTVEAWVKYNPNGNYQLVVSKEAVGAAGGGGGYQISITDTGKARFNIWTDYNASVGVIGATTISPGVWHHVAGVADGVQRRVYLDGQLDGSVTGAQLPTAGTGAFYIGRRGNNTFRFSGLIDEVRVSGAALYTTDFIPQASLTTTAGTTKGLWKFDGQTAADPAVDDSSSNSNNGQLGGGAAYSPDVPLSGRYSLSLNGTDAYVQVPYDAAVNASLSLTGPLTIEAWVKYNPNGNYQLVVSKEAVGAAGGGGGYQISITDTGKARFNIWTDYNASVGVIGVTTLTQGVWHHVAGVADGSQRRIYVDGVMDASVAGAQLPAAGSGAFNIGRRGNNTYRFSGLIDEVRASNGVLYTADFAPPPDLIRRMGTVGLWRFNQKTADDTSGQANNGQLGGGAAFSDEVP